MLTRSYEGFVSKHGQEYTLSGAPEEVRAWHDVIYPRCSNGGGQKKIFGVELRELYARKDEEVLRKTTVILLRWWRAYVPACVRSFVWQCVLIDFTCRLYFFLCLFL